MDPHLFHLREFLLSKIIYFGSEPLIYLNIVLPQFLKLSMSQVSQISLIQVFEVVKQGFHDIFVEVIIWK